MTENNTNPQTNENNNTQNEAKKVPMEKSSIQNFEPNVSATLAYLVPPFTGIIFFVMEKNNKFVRFHALQSVLFGAIAYAAWQIAHVSVFLIIGLLLEPLVSVATFCIWLFCMWKAYNKEEYQLPYIGKIAKTQSEK